MNNISTLSVVIPVFNGAKFVRQAVSSVLGQSAQPEQLEILLINDGSSDSSDQVCRELAQAHSVIEYIALPTNCGVAYARNEGVRRAQFEYLAFLDQDDMWVADKLAIQDAALSMHPNVGYVLGKQAFFLDGINEPPRWFRSKWSDGPQDGFLLSAMVIRTALFRQIGLLNETYRYGADDVDWFARARESGSVELMLPDVVLDRRLHADNASARTQMSNKELLLAIKAKLERRA